MFKYRVEYFDDIEGNTSETGLVCEKTYEEALKSIIDYYGVPASIQMTIFSDNPILTHDEIKDLFDT